MKLECFSRFIQQITGFMTLRRFRIMTQKREEKRKERKKRGKKDHATFCVYIGNHSLCTVKEA